MRLTVGPLPAAVYWRRRAAVVGGLALVVLIVLYAVTGGPGAGAGAGPQHTGSTTATSTDSALPTQTTTSASASPSPSPSAFTLPVAPATGPCTDAEIELTAAATPNDLTVGDHATFALTIKNISSRTCTRDIGSAPQELQLRLGEIVVWSSDDCQDPSQSYNFDQEFAPQFERSFDIGWFGYQTRTAVGDSTCAQGVQQKPAAGGYQLVARLGTKLSAPVPVTIRSSGA